MLPNEAQLDTIVEKYQITRPTPKTLKVNGIKKQRSLGFSKVEEMQLYMELGVTPLENFNTDVFEALLEHFERKEEHTNTEKLKEISVSTSEGYGQDINMASLKILLPLNADRDYIYVDEVENRVLDIKNKNFMDLLRCHFEPKAFLAWKREAIVPVNIGFNPETPHIHYKAKDHFGNEASYFNLYRAPKWRFVEDSKAPAAPTAYLELMEHLFPVEESRLLVEKWLHDAVFYRASTHLLLHGYKGTGKTTLAQLALNLVGLENGHSASSYQIESNFDSSLQNKVLYFWDELDFSSQKAKNKLKKYINKSFAIDQKFKDSHSVVDIHASHIICNNSAEDCFLEVDDRVFTVPDITQKNLKKAWKTSKIVNFLEKDMKNDHYLAQIGYYLKDKYGGNGPAMPANTFVSKNYINVINNSVRPFWKRAVIGMAHDSERFDLNDIRSRVKDHLGAKSTISKQKVYKFIQNYEEYLGVKLAEKYGDSGDVFKSLVFNQERGS